MIKKDHIEQEINEFAEKLRERLRDAYNMASKANDKARQNQKRLYDRNARGIMPQIGDLVLVRQLGLKGKHKLADKWEDDIYQILDKDTNLPFHKVKKENGNGRIRALHRNHLVPITWPILRDEMNKAPLKRLARVRRHEQNEDTGNSSSEEDELPVDLDVHVECPERIDIHDDESVEDKNDEDKSHVSSGNIANEELDETIIAGSADLKRHTGDNQTSDDDDKLPTDIHTNNDNTTDTETNRNTDTDTYTNEAENTTEDLDAQAEHQAEEQMLRRSTRIQNKPNWFRCADYKQHTAKPDWHVRCSFLSDLIILYPNHEDDIITVTLNIVLTT